MNAYLQLLAEGYLEGKVGSGTYVAGSLPDELLRVRPVSPGPDPSARADGYFPERRLSRRGQLLAATPTATARDEGRPLPLALLMSSRRNLAHPTSRMPSKFRVIFWHVHAGHENHPGDPPDDHDGPFIGPNQARGHPR